MIVKFNAKIKIERGKPILYFNNKVIFNLYLSKLAYDNKPETDVVLEIKRKYRKRTQGADGEYSNHNGLYWLYLKLIESETGHFADELHEYFKRKFLTPVELNLFNDKIKIPNSTTKLSRAEFAEYLNKIEILTGVPIPNEE